MSQRRSVRGVVVVALTTILAVMSVNGVAAARAPLDWQGAVVVAAEVTDHVGAVRPLATAITSTGREIVVTDGLQTPTVIATRGADATTWDKVRLVSGSARVQRAIVLAWGDGRATVVFGVGPSVAEQVYYRDMSAAGDWGRPHAVGPAQQVFGLMAERSDRGTFAIVWDLPWSPVVATRAPGGHWRVSTPLKLSESSPIGISIDPRQHIHIGVAENTPDDKRNYPQEVFVIDVDKDGAWGTRHRVGPTPAGELEQYARPDFAANDRGDILVAWSQTQGGHYAYYARLRRFGSAFGPPHRIAGEPGIALSDNRGGAVEYQRHNTSGVGTATPFVQRISPTGVWGTPRPIESDELLRQVRSMTMNDRGDILLSYARYDAGLGDFEYSTVRCLSGAMCSEPARFADLPLLALGPQGGAIAVRQRVKPDDAHVQQVTAQRLAPVAP